MYWNFYLQKHNKGCQHKNSSFSGPVVQSTACPRLWYFRGNIISYKILGAHTKILFDAQYFVSFPLYSKYLPVTGNLFHVKCTAIFFPVTVNFFLWQEVTSLDKKCVPILQNCFLWHYISSCGSNFLSSTINVSHIPQHFFLCH